MKAEEHSTILCDKALTFSGQDSHGVCFKSHMAMENVPKKKKDLKQSYNHSLCLTFPAISIIMVKYGLCFFHKKA